MTPITWGFCLAILWTIIMDIQAQKVDPLVMAVYIKEHNSIQITFTDLKEANMDNLKLPLGDIKPTFIAILCGATNGGSENYNFIMQIKYEIDSIDKNLKCEHQPQTYANPYTRSSNSNTPIYHHIGFRFKIAANVLFNALKSLSEKLKTEGENTDGHLKKLKEVFKSNSQQQATKYPESVYRLLHFINVLDITSQDEYKEEPPLMIVYNYQLMIPTLISHTLIAHMHSDNYEEKCKEINAPDQKIQRKIGPDELVAKIKSKKLPPDHQWRQLVPMQDFKGIYPTQMTCIDLNYVVLHNEAISSLMEIEIFIRKVADVLNEVDVLSGAYLKSTENPDLEENTIPHIVWKKISLNWDKKYAVLVVIHNQETERICNSKKGWGWPERSNNEKGTEIGTMYYCLVDENMIRKLELHGAIHTLPFDLNKVTYENEEINVLERIQKQN